MQAFPLVLFNAIVRIHQDDAGDKRYEQNSQPNPGDQCYISWQEDAQDGHDQHE